MLSFFKKKIDTPERFSLIMNDLNSYSLDLKSEFAYASKEFETPIKNLEAFSDTCCYLLLGYGILSLNLATEDIKRNRRISYDTFQYWEQNLNSAFISNTNLPFENRKEICDKFVSHQVEIGNSLIFPKSPTQMVQELNSCIRSINQRDAKWLLGKFDISVESKFKQKLQSKFFVYYNEFGVNFQKYVGTSSVVNKSFCIKLFIFIFSNIQPSPILNVSCHAKV